jgi:hypothetical protein
MDIAMIQQESEGAVAVIVRRAIQVEAEQLAAKHHTDATQVYRLLVRTARDADGNPLVDTLDTPISDRQLYFAPSLADALRHLPGEDALALFEQEQHDKLEERDGLAYLLSTAQMYVGAPPLFTLDELARLTVELIDYLERNRPHLIETGRPRTIFHSSGWLRGKLTNLYYTKLPASVLHPFAGRDEPMVLTWTRRENDGSAQVSYEETDLIEGLEPADADRLAAGRPKLLDLKIAVLRVLHDAIRNRVSDGLWTRCLRLITETLSADEADLYLRIDRQYSGYDIRTGESMEGEEGGLIPSGLSDLFETIGHYEEELTIGQWHHLREALVPILEVHKFDTLHLGARSYYEVIAQGHKRLFDVASDRYHARLAREESFWQAFRRRVNEALANEFYEEVLVRVKVKRPLVYQFEPHIRTYSDFAKTYLEATGMLPQLSLGVAAPIQDEAGSTARPWDGETIIGQLERLPSGWEHAAEYQQMIFTIIGALFEPDLIDGEMEVQSFLETERRDIIYTNYGGHPFWAYVRATYHSALVMFEVKNVQVLELEHLNQVAGYLGTRLGMLGFIVTRQPVGNNIRRKAYSIYNDTPGVPRKTILILTDEDMKAMIRLKQEGGDPSAYVQDLHRQFHTQVQ